MTPSFGIALIEQTFCQSRNMVTKSKHWGACHNPKVTSSIRIWNLHNGHARTVLWFASCVVVEACSKVKRTKASVPDKRISRILSKYFCQKVFFGFFSCHPCGTEVLIQLFRDSYFKSDCFALPWYKDLFWRPTFWNCWFVPFFLKAKTS